ncbi:MAG: transcriptional repressor [Candidatus Abawacabacteria bacterium]|nr:transcriptional repressor [Candidatus Abawacabacteria bacterium]
MRLTVVREKILAIIKNAKKLVSAKDILRIDPMLDKVTVYRTLDAFLQAGMVREMHLPTGEKAYELGDDHDHHHHFRCERCLEIYHLPCEFDHTIEKWEQKTGFKFHSFDFAGVCKTCLQKNTL